MNKLYIILQGPIFLIAALLLGIIVLPIGFLYTLGKNIYEFKWRSFFTNIFKFIIEILYVLSWICKQIALGIDMLGNVIGGELVEDCVTTVEDTLYGQQGITLSASTGDLEIKEMKSKNGKYLNKTGKWFSMLLSRIFENHHTILAYKYHILNKQLLEDTKTLREDEDYSWKD